MIIPWRHTGGGLATGKGRPSAARALQLLEPLSATESSESRCLALQRELCKVEKTKDDMKKKYGIVNEEDAGLLRIKVGARVQITENHDDLTFRALGFVNGALGVVHSILSADDRECTYVNVGVTFDREPPVILVLMDDWKGDASYIPSSCR